MTPLNPRGFSRNDAEHAKFTNLGLVGITGHSIPKMEIVYDANGNAIQIDMFSAVANRANVQIPKESTFLTSLAGAYWTFESVGGANKYYVWYFINGVGADPALAGRTGIQVTAINVASAISVATVTAINASGAATYVRAIPLDDHNISCYHTEHGAVVAPAAGSSLVTVSTLAVGRNFLLASRSKITYDLNNNPVQIVRVEF